MIKQLLLCMVFIIATFICLKIYGLSIGNLEALMTFSAPEWFYRFEFFKNET